MDWTTLLSVLLPAVSGLVGWLFGSRKRNLGYLDVQQHSLEVLIQSQQDFVDRSVKMAEDYARIQTENANLKAENERLKREVSSLKMQVDRLRNQVNAFLDSRRGVSSHPTEVEV